MVSWDGKNDAGVEVAAGIYFYDLELINSCQYVKNKHDPDAPDYQKIVKTNSAGDETVFVEATMHYNSVPIQDFNDFCCYHTVEINANNIAYLNPPTTVAEAGILTTTSPYISSDISIVAKNRITIDENISVTVLPGVTLLLQTGEEPEDEILLKEAINMVVGSEVLCTIDDCLPGIIDDDPPSQLVANNGGNALPVAKVAADSLVTINEASIYRQEKEADENSVNNVEIYPNPSQTGAFSIHFLGKPKEGASINVTDLFGTDILNTKVSQSHHQLDLTTQPNGIYFVTFNFKTSNVVLKIIKQN